jgi:hypothetical protein
MKMSATKIGIFCLAMAITTSCGKKGDNPVAPVIVDPINTFFKDEVKPALTKPCFSGAYYRKMVSSRDYWLGIGGKVTLPTITFDPLRANPEKPGQYLDNPSVYLGGSMGGQETDIGLTWEVIKDANNNVSADRRAFRPFMRRTSYLGGQTATYENAPAISDYYWYPGDQVTLSVQVLEDKKIKFIVEGEGKRFEQDFNADGYKPGVLGEFKRVNAIDQVNNEGKPVQSTKTKVENSQWTETYLFRSFEGAVVKVPAHSGRLTDMRCPSFTYFSISASDVALKNGAETINISGAGY